MNLPSRDRSGAASISIDQWIALNDELIALVRAGLPLEKGLRDAGKDLGGRLGAVTQAMAARLERGESLVGALEAEKGRFPTVYRAVVEAGVRSGRLSVALEGLAVYARGFSEMRRAIGVAMVYPAIVFLVAYGLMVSVVGFLLPRFAETFESIDPGRGWASMAWLDRLGDSIRYWAPIPPALLLLVGLLYAMTGRAVALRGGLAARLLRRIPWVGRMLEQSQAAGFAEVLALLIDQGVPLDEAIGLAAGAAGDDRLGRSAARVVEELRSGVSPADAARKADRFPPLVRWLLTTGSRQAELARALRRAAETYRRRALRQADVLKTFLPAALLIVVGAGMTLFYAMIVFGPLSVLLRNLSEL